VRAAVARHRPAHPAFEGESCPEDGTEDLCRAFQVLQRSAKHSCKLKLQECFFTFPRSRACLRCPSPSRLPLKSPHLAALTNCLIPPVGVVCGRAAAVRLRVPFLRSGSLGRASVGHRSAGGLSPDGFQGESRSTKSYQSHPLLPTRPTAAVSRGSAVRSGSWRTSARDGRAHRLRRKGAPLRGLPLRVTVPRRGTARACAPLRVPPLGRAPRRGCPLSPPALGGAPRSSHPTLTQAAPVSGPRREKPPD
jgi:hypothetical protein